MKKILMLLMAFLSVGVALYGWGFLIFEGYAANSGMAHHFQERPIAAYLHFGFGPLALAIGGFQFFPTLRQKMRPLHRWVGRTYVLACLLSAVGGFFMALHTTAGPVAMSGFLILSVVWIVTTSFAYVEARAKRFDAHRRWMFRSFALTFGAVTLRFYLPLSLGVMGADFAVAYPVISYVSWLPNLLVAEWLLRKKRGNSLPKPQVA